MRGSRQQNLNSCLWSQRASAIAWVCRVSNTRIRLAPLRSGDIAATAARLSARGDQLAVEEFVEDAASYLCLLVFQIGSPFRPERPRRNWLRGISMYSDFPVIRISFLPIHRLSTVGFFLQPWRFPGASPWVTSNWRMLSFPSPSFFHIIGACCTTVFLHNAGIPVPFPCWFCCGFFCVLLLFMASPVVVPTVASCLGRIAQHSCHLSLPSNELVLRLHNLLLVCFDSESQQHAECFDSPRLSFSHSIGGRTPAAAVVNVQALWLAPARIHRRTCLLNVCLALNNSMPLSAPSGLCHSPSTSLLNRCGYMFSFKLFCSGRGMGYAFILHVVSPLCRCTACDKISPCN